MNRSPGGLTSSPRGLLPLAAATVGVMALTASAGARPGLPTAGFGARGLAKLSKDTRFLGTAVQRNGAIVAVGQRGSQRRATLVIARLTARGRADRSFRGGVVTGPAIRTGRMTGSTGRAVAIQPDGKYVVVGTATDSSATAASGMLVERFNRNGRLDTRFGRRGVVRIFAAAGGEANAVALQRDGRIVVAGTAGAPDPGIRNGTPYGRVALARLTRKGGLDRSFGSRGTAILQLGRLSTANGVAVARDGKIVVAGSQRQDLQTTSALVARVRSNGRLDTGFATRGASIVQYALTNGAYSAFASVDLQRNGRIVAAGAATGGAQSAQGLVVRFTTDGRPDGSFGRRGVALLPAAKSFVNGGDLVPGASGVRVGRSGDVFAGGTLVDSGQRYVAAWALTSRGRPRLRFGKNGVARISPGRFQLGEADALALAANGDLVLAGTTYNAATPFTGLVVRLAAR